MASAYKVDHLVLLGDDCEGVIGLFDEFIVIVLADDPEDVLEAVHRYHFIGHFIVPLNVLVVQLVSETQRSLVVYTVLLRVLTLIDRSKTSNNVWSYPHHIEVLVLEDATG